MMAIIIPTLQDTKMIRPLDDLILLREIDNLKNIDYTSSCLKKRHPHKVVVIRRVSYVKKDVVCDTALKNCTDLTNYLQLGELADQINIRKQSLLDRISFMEKTNAKWFGYKKICGIWYIKVSDIMKQNLLQYQPFLATLSDANNLIECELLGDLRIGFY
jgi:hypothetical protein